MQMLKKLVMLSTVVAMIGSSIGHADEEDCCIIDSAGYGYEDCCRAPCISPYIALGVVAIAAVVAVIVNNNDHDHHDHAAHD